MAFALALVVARVLALHPVGADAPRGRMTIPMMSASTYWYSNHSWSKPWRRTNMAQKRRRIRFRDGGL